MSLKGKVALVTGASRGIGRAIAARLARDGALVCVNYHSNGAAADEVVGEIRKAGGDAFPLQADVGSVPQILKLFENLDAELTRRNGDTHLDILVNNAGVVHGATIDKTTEEEFDRVFATNVKGPFFVTQHALSRLRDGGRIINVASNLARRPIPTVLAYCMTKGAIANFTEGLAPALGKRGITVNTLAPGLTETDMTSDLRSVDQLNALFTSITALGRNGTPEEVADATAFLASADARWVTGQYLEASGGFGLVLPGLHG